VSFLAGTPSDEFPGILETGRASVTTIFVSMSARDPQGGDAEYIEWHSLDHRPELNRVRSLIATARLVSTPECRAARAASTPGYDAVDHVMTYLFSDPNGLRDFEEVGASLRDDARNRPPLPPVARGVFRHQGRMASPRIKIGADVLPWWPARGGYVLIEEAAAPPAPDLVEVPGVAGAWWATEATGASSGSTGENNNLQMTYCYLDDDPPETAARLARYLEKRWADSSAVPLLAAPFHRVVNFEWNRYLP
jgi:hypothetical protein